MSAYVGNESDADVFFDDVTVEHRPGLQVQETQYDPTGLELAGLQGTTPGLKPLNQCKFNGKEFQADPGLHWNDHGWRFFDAQLGRWHSVDPDAEEADQESWTTYQFGMDNALRFNDLDGRQASGPGLPGLSSLSDLADQAGKYINRKIDNAINNAGRALATAAKDAVQSLQVSAYGKAEVKVSGQVGGSAEVKGVGVNGNVKGAEIASVNLEGTYNLKTKTSQNLSDISYAGKDGKHKETSGGGAAFLAGVNRETERTNVGAKTIGTKTSTSLSLTPVPVAGGVQATYINENGQSSLRTGYTNGGSVGLFLNFNFNVEMGLEIKSRQQE